MNVTITEVGVNFILQPFVEPMQISSGIITEAVEARATVAVKVGGHEGAGVGSIYLSDLWAWPGGEEREPKVRAMKDLCERIASDCRAWCGGEPAHPTELGLRLNHHLHEDESSGDMPILARCVCGSIFDAAVHDAVGNALGRSALSFYDDPEPLPSADYLFAETGAAHSIRKWLRKPAESLPAWWALSVGDRLEKGLGRAIQECGIYSYKIKILGRDPREDARRTAEIFRFARSMGVEFPVLSVDSNEGHADADAVLHFLDCLAETDREAYAALAYLEQPTSRNILDHRFDWREVASRKPVLLDEGLTSFDLLPVVKSQGWSGLALKTCKGHSFSLVSAAWALENGLKLSVQDLTNPGFSAVHSYLLASALPTMNGVEINSPQFTPYANKDWFPQLSGLFQPKNGRHSLPAKEVYGLGSSLKPAFIQDA